MNTDQPKSTITPPIDRCYLKPKSPYHSATIAIPETVEIPDVVHAEVKALGPRRDGQAWPFNVGDHVIITEFMGAPIQLDGEDIVVMREKDIVAIIDIQDESAGRAFEFSERVQP